MDMDNDLKRRRITGLGVLKYVVDIHGHTENVAATGVYELGFECPSCKHWSHVFYDDAHARDLRVKFNKAKQVSIAAVGDDNYGELVQLADEAGNEYQTAFDAVNAMLRSHTGAVQMQRISGSEEE